MRRRPTLKGSTLLDWRQKPLDTFRPDRDIPGCFGWWDASQVPGSNGATVRVLKDRSGNNNDMIQQTSAARPTLKAANQNGLNVLGVAASQYMASTGTAWKQPARTQPLTYVALIKFSAQSSGNKFVLWSQGGTFTGLFIVGSSGLLDPWPYPAAGSAGVGGGKGIADGQWHVVVTTMSAAGSSTFVDGYLVGQAATQSHSTNSASGGLTLGTASTTATLVGDFAEGMVFQTDMTIEQVRAVTAYLNTKWRLGLTVPPQESVTWSDVTDAGGQTIRVFAPATLGASAPLIVWNHHQGGTTALIPGIAWYTVVHALVNAGYIVVIPNNHGTDSWTSTVASNDGAAALAWVEANLCTVSRVVLFGMSMGAALAFQQAKDNQYGSKLKGIYAVDGSMNLRYANTVLPTSIINAYSLVAGTASSAISAGATSFSSSVSFPAGTQILVDRNGTNPEIVTVHASGPTGAGPYNIPLTSAFGFAHSSGVPVSDYPTKTAGKDPALFTAGQMPGGLRYRFMASVNDANVAKAQSTDVMKTLVDASFTPAESTVLAHIGTHLETGAWWPSDAVAFADRCV